jgi:hypothetical protein
MEKDIVNRVANSKLITIDLEDYYPEGVRTIIDIKPWLFQELILREKDFRVALKTHDWTQYNNHYVALHCSTDAIIPSWAFMLITTYLTPFAHKVVVGDLINLETVIYNEIIQNLKIDTYTNQPVIVKGCSKKMIPESAYVTLVKKLIPVAKSVMYGEACSSVPLFKKRT